MTLPSLKSRIVFNKGHQSHNLFTKDAVCTVTRKMEKIDPPDLDPELKELKETVFDMIRDVRDPEKPETLEELNVVSEEGVRVDRLPAGQILVTIEFVPTVPHCSLASIIGLTLRRKIDMSFPEKFKVDIFIKEGAHQTADEINKQINDKERISAAMENPNLRDLVDKCVADEIG